MAHTAVMKGRIKRRQAEAAMAGSTVGPSAVEAALCPLCDRPIPPAQRDAHHLVPKSRGGAQTVWLHRICHRQIHALFTETELAREYHQVDTLKAHPEMARFLDWVRRRPDDFFERTRKSQRLRVR
jgi:hypothetical protein